MTNANTGVLAGKVFLVTGGARGLGMAICQMLVREGASVALADINAQAAHAAASQWDTGRVHPVGLDVGNEQSARQAVSETMARFDRLDGVINNAGIDVTLPIQELKIDDWERVIRTNLTGPFLMAKFAAEHLAVGGHIVNIASTAARRAWPNASAYHASKWGLLGLSHALHAELRPRGIKVSAVIAGGMKTPFLLDRFPDLDPDVLQEPANVANAVRFVLTQPAETVIPEVMVLPMKETSWP
jgi:NAD(P)-dependent dehydrogenase (short-subunit alcohol dehydrogenase family)